MAPYGKGIDPVISHMDKIVGLDERGSRQVDRGDGGFWGRAAPSYDVAILGGGLAGLTLAIHLKRTRPQTSVLVLEKREGPAPLAAFKVGESTVPVGAHYFAEIVGAKDHLLERQLRKCGLRYFLPAATTATSSPTRGRPRSASRPRQFPDRPRLVRERAGPARARRRRRSAGCRVGEVELGGRWRAVSFARLGEQTTVQAHWVVDAAGRASLLKRKLGMGTNVGHVVNAAWLRLGGGLRHRGLRARRRGLDGADVRARPAQVQHRPPVRRGVLGVDDPALQRTDHARRVRRCQPAPVRGDLRARSLHELAARPRAAAGGRDCAARSTRSRTSCASRTSPTGCSGCSRRTAGAWSARRAPSRTRSTAPARTSSRSATCSAAI